jgi:hypothetical protein
MSPSGWWERRKHCLNGGMHTFSPRLSVTVVNSAQRAHPLERPLERVWLLTTPARAGNSNFSVSLYFDRV